MRFLSILSIAAFLALASCLGDSSPTFSEQLSSDIKEIDAHLIANGISAIKDVSGVRVDIQTLGTGYVPRLSDKVTLNYTGKLLSGSTFQTSTLTDHPVASLIAGFQIGISQIPVGSTATIYIPSGYGYGQQSANGIPANSNLVFIITLKEIEVTSTELSRLAQDTVAIDEFITDAAITDVVKDTSGLRYKITQTGTGSAPQLYNKVKISYSGYLLTDGEKGSKFFEGSTEPGNNTDSRVVNFIRGFQLGLQKMQKGGKATLYIPSGLAFGAQSLSGGLVAIPSNSILIYDVELIDIMAP